MNQVVRADGNVRYTAKHEDIYDQEIFHQLSSDLNRINNIKDLSIRLTEGVIGTPDDALRNRALNSNIAFGIDFRDLLITTNTNTITNLATENTDSKILVSVTRPILREEEESSQTQETRQVFRKIHSISKRNSQNSSPDATASEKAGKLLKQMNYVLEDLLKPESTQEQSLHFFFT